jgi:hypothetical protein
MLPPSYGSFAPENSELREYCSVLLTPYSLFSWLTSIF